MISTGTPFGRPDGTAATLRCLSSEPRAGVLRELTELLGSTTDSLVLENEN
jgi:hypothetical protein